MGIAHKPIDSSRALYIGTKVFHKKDNTYYAYVGKSSLSGKVWVEREVPAILRPGESDVVGTLVDLDDLLLVVKTETKYALLVKWTGDENSWLWHLLFGSDANARDYLRMENARRIHNKQPCLELVAVVSVEVPV